MGGGNSLIGRCCLERLNLLGMGYTDSGQGIYDVRGSSAVKDKSVVCILVVDGEGDKGQRTITKRWALGKGSWLALPTTEGMERKVGSLFLERALKTEKRDAFVKEITGDSRRIEEGSVSLGSFPVPLR